MPRALLAGLVLLLMAGHLLVLAASSSSSSSSYSSSSSSSASYYYSSFTVTTNTDTIPPTTTSTTTTTTTETSVRPLQKQQPPPLPPFLLPFAAGQQQSQQLDQEKASPPIPAAPLEIINPWLSACDLQPASATDLQGACSATMWGPGTSIMCLPPCRRGSNVVNNNDDDHDILFAAAAANNNNNNNKKRNSNNSTSSNQCLFYLEESHKDVVCDHRRGYSPEERRVVLEKLRIRHCCEHSVLSALPSPAVPGDHDDVLRNDDACHRLLDALLEVDALAARMSCEYAEVLTRYDCGQNYSIAHNCNDCQEAYRQWVCSSLVPHFVTGVDGGAKNGAQRLRPCRSVCQAVEQRCPYMLPGDRAPAHPTQYAGEPTFLCLDPNIPETGEQRAKSSHGDEDCCYTHCGTPGRGLCVQCPRATNKTQPSEPFNDDTPVPVRCAAGTAPPKSSNCKATATATTTSTTLTATTKTEKTAIAAISSAHSVSASRTQHFNRICAWWTACCTFVLFTYYSRTISDVLLQLLVMCANSVRTPLSRIKTKWRSCS